MTLIQEVLQILLNHNVDFIVVGGISAVLNGAPVNTFDLDIVHSPEPDNIARLSQALAELDAEYRYTGGRKLRPAGSHLASKEYQLLITRFGPLDIHGMIGNDLSYQNLLPHTTEMFVTETVKSRILNLETLIEIKEGLATEKDRAALPILKRTLEERRKS